jgi:hypothetical protein
MSTRVAHIMATRCEDVGKQVRWPPGMQEMGHSRQAIAPDFASHPPNTHTRHSRAPSFITTLIHSKVPSGLNPANATLLRWPLPSPSCFEVANHPATPKTPATRLGPTTSARTPPCLYKSAAAGRIPIMHPRSTIRTLPSEV